MSKRLSLLFFLLSCFISVLALAAPPATDAPSPLDAALAPVVASDRVTVVHTWAPWCPNCFSELRDRGWADFIEKHPDVQFAFVEIWNDGRDSSARLRAYDVGDQPNFQHFVDPNPRSGPEQSKTLLGQPLTWVPSTWIYHRGRVRFAFLYGEIRFDMLEQLLADTTTDWSGRTP